MPSEPPAASAKLASCSAVSGSARANALRRTTKRTLTASRASAAPACARRRNAGDTLRRQPTGEQRRLPHQ